MPEIGTLLGAKYRVLDKLGEGGMGTVYRAENELTGKLVAIKWMHPQLAANPDSAERMLREARAASRISHPNVVDVYDVVRDDQTLFLVMELLQGETLREWLRHNPQPRLSEFIGLLSGAMAGVAAAHEQGVIHRDLKPDNIFLERIAGVAQPVAKVVDFGIAKLAEIRGSTLTETGAAIGTPVYMSLEQLRGDRDIDARTDVYAFGVMLYEAVTGHMPYNAATLPELAIKVATTDPASVRSLRRDLPAALAETIDRAIARDRTQRLPDVHTLLQGLLPFATNAANGRTSRTTQDTRSGSWPNTLPRGQRSWDETQALPSSTGPLLSPRALQKDSVRTDSLTGRELSHTRTLAGHNRPIWIAAGAFFVASALAAYLLLGDALRGPEQHQTTTTTTIDAQREDKVEVKVGPIIADPPATPDPEIPVDPTGNSQLPPVVPQLPVEPLGDARRDAPGADPERPERPHRERPSRPRAQPRETPAPPDKERIEPAAPKPKNAADVLGF